MNIRDYLSSLGTGGDDARELFAFRCGTSLGHLRNVASGCRACGVVLAVNVERESGGVVRRWEARPDDWHLIWPELIGAEGAPSCIEGAPK